MVNTNWVQLVLNVMKCSFRNNKPFKMVCKWEVPKLGPNVNTEYQLWVQFVLNGDEM